MSTLCHHGVKGQRWGVRRYQYVDGSLTPAGKKRLTDASKQPMGMRAKLNRLSKSLPYFVNGKQRTDEVLKKGTDFSRIQSSPEFEKFAFYATHLEDDKNKYLGLFGQNLINRAKQARTSDEAQPPKVYQVKIEAIKKLKMPSDENASDITNSLLKDPRFKNDLYTAIAQSKIQMRRPSQQELLKNSLKVLNKRGALSESDKFTVYQALNLSLTFHDPTSVRVQDKFYGEMKRKGYNAILDYNDKQYSSYKAKQPVIVFDTNSVRASAVLEPSPGTVKALNKKYNRERILREIPAVTFSVVSSKFNSGMNEANSYLETVTERYLEK